MSSSHFRLVRIVQKYAKRFSTQAQKNYKVLALESGQNSSVLVKKVQNVTELDSRTFKISVHNLLGNSIHNNYQLKHKHLPELISRNYKIPALCDVRKCARKRRHLLKQNQFLHAIASRNYKSLSPYKSSDGKKCCLLKGNHLLTKISLRNFKVAVIGAAGAVGQSVSLLLKLHPLIKTLALYDLAKITPGVAVDLSHINTCTRVVGINRPKQMCDCLAGADLVIVTLCKDPKVKVRTSREELFNDNAPVISNITYSIANSCPRAMMAIVTNPVNSLVPIAVEIMKQRKVSGAESRIFGVTTLDLVRASTFVSQLNCSDPATQNVPVVCGHGAGTIIPLLSQSTPGICIDDITSQIITKRIQDAGMEVLKIKGSPASLTMAYAVVRFADAVLRALRGDPNVTEYAFVKTPVEGCDYFAGPIILCRDGVKTFLGIGKVKDNEKELLDQAIPILQQNIQTGIDYVKKSSAEKDIPST